ncbi:MAG: zinc transport system ATP-binding protein [Parcubacteria group bacterium Gr01-1014_2]|nr:MAG: zinc transport system ATP-binding protein [Parcubacteria group bacterium Gr01-1014_2]
MQSESILKVENLNVAFDGNKILEDLSFEIKKGDITAVIGPNGAGKTVLFRALLGLVPYSGKFLWQKNIKVGYVPQRFIVERDLPLSVKEFLSYKGSRDKISEVLKWVGFQIKDEPPHSYMSGGGEHHLFRHLLNLPLGVLSGGELQKVLIAFALLGNPKVLLFDEPTTGVDIGGEETIYNLLKKLRDEHDLTVIFISHDIHVVYQYANNVLCLNKEKICFGPPHQALSSEELKKLYGTDIGVVEHSHVLK